MNGEPGVIESPKYDSAGKLIKTGHDLLTSGAIALLAFMAADLSHEVLGHGSIAFLLHARHIALSYTALSTDISSRTLVLAGPVANLIFGVVGFTVLRRWRTEPKRLWFLFLFASMSLMNLSSYLILSGVTGTGDLAAAIAGVPQPEIVRSCMGIIGLISYGVLVRVLAQSFRIFARPNGGLRIAAYSAPLVLNTAAASISPLGLHFYLISALPATAGVNIFLLILPYAGKSAHRDAGSGTPEAIVKRSLTWILTATVLGIAYVLLLGPGIALQS